MSEKGQDEAPEDEPPRPSGDDSAASDPLAGSQTANTFFNGPVTIRSAQLGITNAPVRRRLTGPLRDAELDEALRHYLQPAPFADAADILERSGLVVLCGPEAIGKRAGSLALLDHRCVERPLYGLSPALTLGELLRDRFRAGRGYVIHGRAGGQDPRETLEDELRELARKLDRAQASLVITTAASNAGMPRDLVVEWEAPPPLELLLRCFEDLALPYPQGALAARVEERFRKCRVPADIVSFATRLANAGGAETECVRLLEESEARTVAAWFDTDPADDAVLAIAALSFVHDVPEPEFERRLRQLQAWMPDEEPPPSPRRDADDDAEQAQPVTPPPARRLRQRRSARLADIGLVERIQSGPGLARDPRLAFAASADRERVLCELTERYDGELWEPVGGWLRATVRGADDETALSVALGIALLARVIPTEVRRTYLDPWAAGSAGEREIACYALWYSSLDDDLASWALEVAVQWAGSPSQRMRETALVCLSGELGLRFPGDALRWMWHLATRPPADDDAPRRAFADFLCASLVDRERDLSVLRFVGDRIERARTDNKRGTYEIGLSILDELLSAQAPTGGPAIAAVIVAAPEACAVAGPLWAQGLGNRRHRGHAFGALLETLRRLNDADEGLERTSALGAAMERALGPSEFAILKEDVYRALAAGDRGSTKRAGSILSALVSRTEPAEDDDAGELEQGSSEP